jgi:hypothetical protein
VKGVGRRPGSSAPHRPYKKPGLGTRPGAPSGLVGLVECALMPDVV